MYVTVDIDVLDPAFVPGTGTPEPGGLSSAELLWAAREVAARAEVVGADLVEVILTAIGTADSSALAGRGPCARSSPGSRCDASAVAG